MCAIFYTTSLNCIDTQIDIYIQCVCVCVCRDKSWRLNEHGRRISGDEQKHRQQASSWSVHTQLPAHNTHTHEHTRRKKHTKLIHPSTRPLARPTHNPSVTCVHKQTHKCTLRKKQLIGLMMITELALSKDRKICQCKRVITTHICV